MSSAEKGLLVDDFANDERTSALGTRWQLFSDQVMGGVSDGRMITEQIDGRTALCLGGRVSLENSGGFLQIAFDLARDGFLDASAYDGIRLVVRGNGERYNLHLKTADTRLPWQSYRQGFDTSSTWREVRLPFEAFAPYRVDVPFDQRRCRRLGVVAVGRRMTADICVTEMSFY